MQLVQTGLVLVLNLSHPECSCAIGLAMLSYYIAKGLHPLRGSTSGSIHSLISHLHCSMFVLQLSAFYKLVILVIVLYIMWALPVALRKLHSDSCHVPIQLILYKFRDITSLCSTPLVWQQVLLYKAYYIKMVYTWSTSKTLCRSAPKTKCITMSFASKCTSVYQ